MTPWRLVVPAMTIASALTGCADEGPPFDYLCLAQQGAAATATVAIDVGATDECGGEGEGEDGAGEGDCAGPADGYQADGPYDAGRGFGWLGDAEVGSKASWFVDVFPVGTHEAANPWSDHAAYHAEIEPYLTWAEGLSGYRVDVPDGAYRVTLMFLEPTYPEPGLRLIDVSSSGVVLLDDLDLAARAGQDQIVELAVQALATGGALELGLTSVAGDPPLLAGLRLEPAVEGGGDAVTGLEARAGAGEGLLRWDRPAEPVRGWAIARSSGGGEFQAVSSQLTLIPSLVDRHRSADEQLTYRLWPIGADCSAGPPADSAAIDVLDPTALGLPVIDVTVDPGDLSAIHADPAASIEVPAGVTSGGESATGTIRLRGQSTRWLPKRGFKLVLADGTIDGRDRLELLAEQSPPSRLWQLAAYDLFHRMGSLASHARPVLLRINGAVYGVYDDIEHVGDDLLTDRGYGVDDRFRIGYDDFGLRLDDGGNIDLSGFDKKENEDEPSPELEQLLIWLNTAAQHDLDAQLESYVDVELLVDYMVGQILVANPEVVDGAHYLVLDPASGAFLMLPWDLNNDTWSRPTQPLAQYTVYAPTWGFQSWLWSRLLDSPTYRARLVQRLGEVVAAQFAADTPARIEALQQQIAAGLAVEPFLFTRRYDAWAADGAPQMQAFVTERAEVIGQSIEGLALLGQVGVVISAVEAGATPSVTLENRGDAEVDLGRCFLALEFAELQALPLEGALAAGATTALATDAVRSDGGYLVLSCAGGEGEGQGESDDEGAATAVTSLVFYPPLTGGQLYSRTGDSWEVLDGP